MLDRHPDLYLAKPFRPEPKFFLVDQVYAKGVSYYASTWFDGAPVSARAGEKSTDYLESATAAERMARDVPRVKLVFILRNPVERAYSNYCWSRMNGLETEEFSTALVEEERRERELPARLRFARPFSYFSRGLYADLLTPYFDRFAREQVLVLRFEDLLADPRGLAARLHGFLGVDPRPEDAEGMGVINPSDPVAGGLSADVRRRLADRYAEPNRRLALMLGSDFEWSPR